MFEVLLLIHVTLATSLLVPLFSGASARLMLTLVGTASFAVASLLLYAGGGGEFYGGLVTHDKLSSLLLVGASLASAISLIAYGREASKWPTSPAFYSLAPLTLFGLFFLAGANNVIAVVASWLLVSVASYVIIATPGDAESRTAAVKYIYIGIIATILLAIWAPAYVYETGQLMSEHVGGDGSLLVFPLLLAAIGFKIGVVPFHWWLPSVYGKADGRSVAFVAGAVKLGFIALLVRIVDSLFSGSSQIALALAIISAITMTYGNVAALTTRELQRMLAYSSIAQVGYLLAGLAVIVAMDGVADSLATIGIALLSLSYAFSKTPLFSAIGGMREGGLSSDSATMISSATLLASLLGVPPLLGFWGKLFIFMPLASYSLPLLVLALLNSGVSSAYYIRALRDIATSASAERAALEGYRAALVLGALLTILLGILAPLFFV